MVHLAGLGSVRGHKEAVGTGGLDTYVTHHYCTGASPSNPTYKHMKGSITYNQLTYKERAQTWFRMGRLSVWVQAENMQLLPYCPTQGCPWKTVGRAFGCTLGHPLCVEEVAWNYNTYWFTGNSEWLGLLVRGLDGKDGKIGVKEVWGRGMWVDLWEWAQSEGLCLFTLTPTREHPLQKKH